MRQLKTNEKFGAETIKKIILVAGGAGFIGSHIVDLLLENGYQVRVLDDLSSGKIENIRHHMEAADFRVY